MVRVGSLFSGIGGIDLGLQRAGMEIAWQVEIDPYCQQVLAKHYPDVPRYGDIKTVRGDELEPVDILAGGPPCQPVSIAGKRRGAADDRWLWGEALRLVDELRPRWCLFENPTGIVSMGLDDILAALEGWGYSWQTAVIPACAVGAPHRRNRVWIVAYAGRIAEGDASDGPCVESVHSSATRIWTEAGNRPANIGQDVADSAGAGLSQRRPTGFASLESQGTAGTQPGPQRCGGRAAKSGVGRVFDGLPAGMDFHWPAGPGEAQHDWEPPRLARGVPHRTARLKALGNAVVPQVVEMIGRAIMAAEVGR